MLACDLLHLDPSWINLLLRELLDHRLGELGHTESWHRDMEKYCHRIGLHFDQLIDTQRSFLTTGRLLKDYLGFLWRDVPGLDDATVLERMMDTMSTYGAMFPCESNKDEVTEFVIPARLSSFVADANLCELERAISHGVTMQFTFQFLAKYVPPGIMAQVVGGFCRGNNIVFRACWSKGAAFTMGRREHLICLHEPTDTLPARTEINVTGSDKPTVWDAGFRAEDELRKLLREPYGGLRFVPPGNPDIREGRYAWEDTLGRLEEHLQSLVTKVSCSIYLPWVLS